MGFFRGIRLFYECFRLAGPAGLVACMRYMTGSLTLSEIDSKSSVFSAGGSDA